MYAMYEYGSQYPNAAGARRAALWSALEGSGLGAGACLAAREPRELAAVEGMQARAIKRIGLAPGLRRSHVGRFRQAVGTTLIWLGQRLQGMPPRASGVAPTLSR